MMRFETSKSEQEIFGDLERLCASPGYIHVLAALSFRDNFVTFPGELTPEALAASYVEGRTVRTEFSTLMGLMLKSPIDFEKPPSAEIERMIKRTIEVLEELHATFNMPMMASLRRGFEEAKAGVPLERATPFLQGEVLREPIFYGGESAYDFQYRAFAVQRYVPDDDWLFANRGFRIDDAAKVARALNRYRELEAAECCRVEGVAGISYDEKFAQAASEQQFGRDARIRTTDIGCKWGLPRGQTQARIAIERRNDRLIVQERLIAVAQQRQRFFWCYAHAATTAMASSAAVAVRPT
jgi:hypothetical protein